MVAGFKEYSTPQNEETFPVLTRPETNVCSDIGEICSIPTADAQRGVHALRHNSQLFVAQTCTLCQKFLISFQSPDRHSLLVAVLPRSH
jgi:hypothetical protein